MSELDHLGGALRERLHALVADLNPSDSLLASVEAIPDALHVDAIPRPGHGARWRDRLTLRRIVVTIPLPIAAAVAAVLAFGGTAPTASLGSAVTLLPNGEFRISMTQLGNPAAANAMIRRHGVHNIVVVPLTSSCPNRDMTYDVAKVGGSIPVPVQLWSPKKIAPGHTVIVGSLRRGDYIEQATGITTGKVPTCASTRGWGPNMGGPFKSWPAPKGAQG